MNRRNRRPAEPFISLEDATFRLGEDLIFERTSWVFRRCEHWGVIGPNGSGKSLFADAIRGRLPLVHGELTHHFRLPQGSTLEGAIGHVSFEERKSDLQDMAIQSRWNSLEEESSLLVRDFLAYDRVMDVNPFEVTDQHRKARPLFERRKRHAIYLLDIEKFLRRRLLTLSNGERQRVQLARALCHPLRLLILDEPFVGLDKETRAYFQGALDRLMHTAVRVLIITTRIEDLPKSTTHLLCVDKCQVVVAGPRSQIFRSSRAAALSDRRRSGKNAYSRLHGRDGEVSGPLHLLVPKTLQTRNSAGIPLVELENVSVRYGKSTILDRVDWTIHAGESWALLGPNGSGKTTLLSLILGDNPQAYQNCVRILGRQRGTGESIWDLKRQLGWVSPELQLHFDDLATCFQVVATGFHETIGLFETPTRQQQAIVRAWLRRFHLTSQEQTSLCALSPGQQRLLLLARALVKKPRLVVMDEPCQGLDREHREFFVGMVEGLIRHGEVTVIYVTHRRDEIPPSISRVLRLNKGRASAHRRF